MGANSDRIRKFYLDRVNVHKREGESEAKAHEMAERETIARYGRIPGEGKR